jgi:hypothetical protein
MITSATRRSSSKAEGASRGSKTEKARAFTIGLGKALEVFAVLEVVAITGEADAEHVARCHTLTYRLYALLTGFIG